jgi:GLPGLI family protein
MRNLLLTLSMLFSFTVFAQDKAQYMEIDYRMEMKLDAEEVLKNVPAAWKSQVEEPLRQEIKKGIFVDYKLKTNGTESEYKLQEKINNDQSPAGFILQQITAMDKEALYKNIVEKFYLKPVNAGKSYLIKDDLKDYKWKITKESVEIAGFPTYKATGVMNDSIQVVAWYTPKINLKDGPDRIWGLPGLILKAEFQMNGTDLIIDAVKVAVKEEVIKINKPTKGEIVTDAQFMQEMIALQEKYKEMYGGGVDTE